MKKNLILVLLALISTAFCFAANPVTGKLDIEIAPGCQVEFDNRGFYFPENKLTIKSRKGLQEVGYKFQ